MSASARAFVNILNDLVIAPTNNVRGWYDELYPALTGTTEAPGETVLAGRFFSAEEEKMSTPTTTDKLADLQRERQTLAYAAQSRAITSAWARTVCVAFSSLSGG